MIVHLLAIQKHHITLLDCLIEVEYNIVSQWGSLGDDFLNLIWATAQ